MANMFSGNTEKRIPKSIDECIKQDYVSSNLWRWCERLEVLGKVLFWIIIIVGIFIAITTSISTNEVVLGSYYKYTKTERSFDTVSFITSIISVLLYAFIEYCVYHVLALLIGALASIVQNTKVTANLALYNSAKAKDIRDEYNSEETVADNAVDKNEDKCNEWAHKKYISKMKKTDADSEDAHWEFNQSLCIKTLVCNHCGKELMFINVFEEDGK